MVREAANAPAALFDAHEISIATPHVKDGPEKVPANSKQSAVNVYNFERHFCDAAVGTVLATMKHRIQMVNEGDLHSESVSIVLPDGSVLAGFSREHRAGLVTFTVDGSPYATFSKSGGLRPKTTITRATGTGGLSDLNGDSDPCCPCGAKGQYGLYSLDESVSYAPPVTKLVLGQGQVPTSFRFTPDAVQHQPLDAAAKLDLVLMVAAQLHVCQVSTCVGPDMVMPGGGI